MRTLDRHLQRIAQFGGAADVVDMSVGQPDLFDGDVGLLDRRQDLRDVAAGMITTAFFVASHHNSVQFC